MAAYDDNKSKVPDLDQFKDADNKFLKSIYDQAQTRTLSDNQIRAANNVWEKFKNPPVWIKFSDAQVETLITICALLLTIQGRYASEFVYKMKDALHRESKLSQKQYSALLIKAEHFKKALMSRIWQSTQ